MATNPFTAKSYVDKAKEDLKKDSQQQSRADVPKPSTPSTSTTKENVFTEKAKGYSKGRSSKEDYVPTNQVKEGLYAELNTEGSGSGKLMINRADESTRFTGNTYSGRSGKNPDFSGETIIASSEVRDSRGNLIYSARTYDSDRQPNVIEGSFGSDVVRSVERGEPNAVFTAQTGKSFKESRPIQTESIKSVESREREALKAERNIEAQRKLEIRKAEAIASAKKSISKGVYDTGQVKYLESLPASSFAPVTFGRMGLDFTKKGRELIKENPSLAFDVGAVERGTYYESKVDYAQKDFGGKVLGFFSDAEIVQLGLDIGGYKGSGIKRKQVQESLIREELKGKGYSEEEFNYLIGSITKGSRIRQAVVGVAQISPEITSEALGAKFLGKGLSAIKNEPILIGAKESLKKTVPTYIGLGALEGASTVAITEQAQGKVKGVDVFYGASVGALSAPFFGAIPLALEVKGGGKSIKGKVLRKVGEFADAPSEQIGDITYAKFGSRKIFSKYDEGISGVKTITFTPSDSIIKDTSNVFLNKPSIPTSTKASNVLLGQNLPTSRVNVPSNVNVLFSEFTPFGTPVDVPSEVEVPVSTATPTVVESVVPTVVSTSGLPLIPPIFDFGGSSKGRSVRQGKKYYNELALGLSLLGSTSKKKSKSMKKDRGNKRKSVNLGFGGLGMINLGRV